MGPSSHSHRKSCTALSDIFSSFAFAPDSPFVIRVFPHIENCTGSSNLDPLSYFLCFPFPFASASFGLLPPSAFLPFRAYSLPAALLRSPLPLLRFADLYQLSASFPACNDQALDRLVSASSHVTMLSPLTYLPCRLQGVLLACAMAVFFLRWASRLDAFSVYPLRTSLPCYAVGTTTVAPVVRSPRSSRTRGNSSHDSCAHDG